MELESYIGLVVFGSFIISIIISGIVEKVKNNPKPKGDNWLNWSEDNDLNVNLWDKDENRKDYDED